MLVVVEGRLTLETQAGSLAIESAAHVFDSSQAHGFANVDDRPVRFYRSTIW